MSGLLLLQISGQLSLSHRVSLLTHILPGNQWRVGKSQGKVPAAAPSQLRGRNSFVFIEERTVGLSKEPRLPAVSGNVISVLPRRLGCVHSVSQESAAPGGPASVDRQDQPGRSGQMPASQEHPEARRDGAAYNPSAGEAEAGGSQVQIGLSNSARRSLNKRFKRAGDVAQWLSALEFNPW
ncbi:Hypothetical predicted protein [Marmota monax]|uniref:Uncharacterized protein n=1 Tax=Marmota monax TaxID=9995 RepID=A0A5E4BH68_MARMO|nr:Hypothetical predicted protein [Marmota monax]